MPAYTVVEWGALTYGDDHGQIPAPIADRLAAVAERSTFAGSRRDGVLEHGRHALRARGIVGVVAAGDSSLEILPKVDAEAGEDIGPQAGDLRRRLVHMLAVAHDLKIDPGAITSLAWQRETVLEILIRLFADRLAEAIRLGMPRRYIAEEDDLRALRGRLDVTRQFTRHAVNPSRLACRYDALSVDTGLNRIMKAAVLHLCRLSQRAATQQRLRRLALDYAEVADVPPNALPWHEVVIDRTNGRWQQPLALARLFLQGRHQTTAGGAGQGMALLFDMGELFEKYVGRLLCRALAGTDHKVVLQGGGRYCLAADKPKDGLFQTKPDIVIRQAKAVTHVIDTKWKKIARRLDDRKHGVSQSDIYQMMAYAQLYGAPRIILLYPHHAALCAGEGVQASHHITGQPATIAFASLDVAQPGDRGAPLRRLLGFEPSALAASRPEGGAPGAGGESEAGAEVLAQGGG